MNPKQMQKNDQFQLDDASDGSPDAEVSAADIISKVYRNLQPTSGIFFEIRAKLVPWLLFWACSLPSRPLFFMFSYRFLLPFPLPSEDPKNDT